LVDIDALRMVLVEVVGYGAELEKEENECFLSNFGNEQLIGSGWCDRETKKVKF
jgi:hypothetical protein